MGQGLGAVHLGADQTRSELKGRGAQLFYQKVEQTPWRVGWGGLPMNGQPERQGLGTVISSDYSSPVPRT